MSSQANTNVLVFDAFELQKKTSKPIIIFLLSY